MKKKEWFLLSIPQVVVWRNGTLKHLFQWAIKNKEDLPHPIFVGDQYIAGDDGRMYIYADRQK